MGWRLRVVLALRNLVRSLSGCDAARLAAGLRTAGIRECHDNALPTFSCPDNLRIHRYVAHLLYCSGRSLRGTFPMLKQSR
jgi:hypothetical protein